MDTMERNKEMDIPDRKHFCSSPIKYCFLLPAYKCRFFEEALGSILRQTYRNFEVIVSDDCSPDNLKRIVDKFADPRVRYRRNDTNIGAENLVDHWNLLLSLTDADFIILASDDDVYDEGFLESIDNLIPLYPKAEIFRPRIRTIDANGTTLFEEKSFAQYMDLNSFADVWGNMLLSTGIPFYVFCRKTLLDNGGVVNYPYAWFSDDATVMKMVSIGGIAITDDILFSFRRSPYSISSYNDNRTLRGKVEAAEQFYELVKAFKPCFSNNSYKLIKRYIQFTSKNEFRMSVRPLSILIFLWMNSGYASLRWRLSLFKMWIYR